MFSKNSTIFLIITLFLVFGLIIGYSVGVNKVFKPQEVVFNNPAVGNKTKVSNVNITAKQAYDIALSESRLWPEDAYLTEIELNSKKFDEKGLSSGWNVVFYSKLKNKIFEVMIKDGESRGTIGRDSTMPLQTLKGEMVDSAALAKSFFASYPPDTEIISMKMYYDKASKKFLWTVFFPKGSHTIDAEM